MLRQLFGQGLLLLAVFSQFELKAQFTDFLNETLNTSERPKPKGRSQLGKIFVTQKSDIHLKDSKAFIFSKIRDGESIYEGDTLFVGKTQAKIVFDEKYGSAEVVIEANSIVSFNSLVQINDVPVIELEGGSISIAKAPKKTKQALVVRREKEAYVVTQEKNQLALSFDQGPQASKSVSGSKQSDSLSAEAVAFTALVTQSNTVDLIDASKDLARVAKIQAKKELEKSSAIKSRKKQVSTDLALQSVITSKQADLPELALKRSNKQHPAELPPKKDNSLETLDNDYSHLNKAAKLPGTIVFDEAEVDPFEPVDLSDVEIQTSKPEGSENVDEKVSLLNPTEPLSKEKESATGSREPKKFHALLGGSLITQNFSSNASESTGTSLGLRARLRWEFSDQLSLGLMYIGTLSNLSGTANVTPAWLLATAEYKVLNRQKNDPIYLPHLHLVFGAERYTNNVGDVQNQVSFLNSYISATGGFRSRFDIYPKWQIGGDFLYTYLSNAQKFHLQGDLIYQFHWNLTLGAGYWLESVNSSDINLQENSFALELFVETGF